MSSTALSYAARVALLSLRDRPEHDTPRQIASAPLSLSGEDVASGLRELRRLGFASEAGGHWQLTHNGSVDGRTRP